MFRATAFKGFLPLKNLQFICIIKDNIALFVPPFFVSPAFGTIGLSGILVTGARRVKIGRFLFTKNIYKVKI